GIRYVTDPLSLGRPDLIILPGSKSTIADLEWLRETGLYQAILAGYRNGSEILGVCGGYQMLGRKLFDPETGEKAEGFGLLPIDTEFLPEKMTRQVNGTVLAEPFYGAKIGGYEIHTGRSVCYENKQGEEGAFCRLRTESGSDQIEANEFFDGCTAENVYGTYVHGLFDSGELVEKMEKHFLDKRGLTESGSIEELQSGKKGKHDAGKTGGFTEKIKDFRAFQEDQYDILAETVRKNLDMGAIYREMNL
ncbi:MAG: hypothetical protein IJ073_04655, partial [Lachnospiraceae bacterium]|nr:hypothetical protein [Lachnospiraceae bacterium]